MSSQAAGGSNTQQRVCIGVATTLTVLSIIVVALRIFTRIFIVQNAGKDDCIILFALLLTIGYLITIFVLRDNGLGLSGTILSPGQMTAQVKTTLAIQIIYYFSINAIKISILLFYLRIATAKKFEMAVRGTILFLVGFCSICVICCLAQCVPLHKMWDLTGTVDGTCINTTALFYTTSSINIIVDVWVLVLPITTLLKVQRPKREKVALVGIFSLGIFSCIASIVRLYSIRIYTESSDPFKDSVPINTWSMVEVNLGILCASIPSLKALFSKAQRYRSSTYQFHSRGKSYGKNMGNVSSGTAIQNRGQAGIENVEIGDSNQNQNQYQTHETATKKSTAGVLDPMASQVSDSEIGEQLLVQYISNDSETLGNRSTWNSAAKSPRLEY